MMFHRVVILFSTIPLLFAIATSSASELDIGTRFGGPNATENAIAKDRAPQESIIEAEPLKVWKGWKQELTDSTGISFSIDYAAVSAVGTEI